MPHLQVKNVPDALYDALRARAASSRSTIGEYVLRVLEDDLSRPTVQEWLQDVAAARPLRVPDDEAVRQALDDAADELDGGAGP